MESILGQTGTLKKRPEEINPLLLAYMGDAVYELFIRHHLLARGETRANKIHGQAVRFVSAAAQAEAVRILKDWLTEEEKEVVKRGRNAKAKSVPKNANTLDYRYSTGLETLIGHWYLTGNTDRLTQGMKQVIQSLEGALEDGE
ncbi:Mini-ribonuclease 3 [Kroppenstedtia eburnea]|uniref:Mini-ribonuclease 3 n=1 Tax=Kroppenstedtia eburnea TaxID=714067 RepID=A0A1N7MZG1_9BACL|nr:ribonuclease III domain-containing protein [Kroppenstedtia eburnea]QKI80738.1 ribonuclease III [Kroppenstedtia eburnea]SIS91269.1 ribonuclease-3 family protein [Kroppenstedtia eburnea]